jgi:hypothetical protein
MRIQLNSDYKVGSILEIDDPHDSNNKLKIQLPQDYEANTWVEVRSLKTFTLIHIDTPRWRFSSTKRYGYVYKDFSSYGYSPNLENASESLVSVVSNRETDVGVEAVVYTQAQPILISNAVPIGTQPQQHVVVQGVIQPIYVHDSRPNVVVIEEKKQGLDEGDCCAILLGVCLCSWFFAALSR